MDYENINAYQGKSITQLLNLFTKHKIQIINTNANIYFNKKCLQLNILPNYTKLIIKNNNNKTTKYIKHIRKHWIKDEIKHQYAKLNKLNEKLIKIHLHLANTLEQEKWNYKYICIHNTIHKHKKQKYKTINKKLTKLITENNKESTHSYKNETHKFHPKHINLSNINFTNNEIEILQNANKYNHTINNIKTIENIIVETEEAINKIEPEKQDEIRSEAITHITNYIKKHNTKQKKYNPMLNTIKNIKQKLESNNLTITKADKSNATVIIDKNEIDTKTINFITENNCIEIKNDPTNKYNTQIINMIKLNNKLIDSDSKFKYIINNPKPPKLNSLIKIHKENKPIRPLINSKTAPNYKIAKLLTHILKDKLKLENKYNIKNTIELTKKLNTIIVNNNTKLFSFDITNMYTNIPIQNTLNIIKQKLIENNENNTYIKQITNSLNIILNQNYFEYNNKIYKQTDGLAMGAPTSSIISEIFLQEIDKTIINIIKKHDPQGQYYRYVDDAIYISQNNGYNIKEIETKINNIHKTINFTVEEEKNNTLNYLDIKITRTKTKFDYAIYRKPTQTNLIIPNTSMHPPQHKMAAFNSLIHRMLQLPLNKQEQNKERNIIHQIATENGYKIKTIIKLENKIKRKLTKINNTTNNTSTNNIYTKFTYYGNITKKIAKLFNNTNLKIAYQTQNITFNLLKQQTIQNQHNKHGVYKIKCPDCNKFYIGQTKKKLKERFTQHLNGYKKPEIYKSNVATHAINNNHNFPHINNMTLIKTLPKGNKMNIWENMEIYKHYHNNTIIKEQTQIKTKQDDIFKTLKFIKNKI
jgi:hypothetical protein